jgi:hypothetical protein
MKMKKSIEQTSLIRNPQDQRYGISSLPAERLARVTGGADADLKFGKKFLVARTPDFKGLN